MGGLVRLQHDLLRGWPMTADPAIWTGSDTDVAGVLNRTADLIEERGWATGNCGMKVIGPLCLEGAIAAVLGTPTSTWAGGGGSPSNDPEPGEEFYVYDDDLRLHPAYEATVAYLRLSDQLWTWNDENGRTATEVVEALRAAALIAETTAVRTVAPEAELTPVTVAGMAS